MKVIGKNKRGRSIILPSSGSSFRVPANVSLIGTMSTPDRFMARSAELLDTALRRRFGFVELTPVSVMPDDAKVAEIPLGPWLENMPGKPR